MTEIYLIRHTQAEGNVYHAMQGHWDGDVTALGLRQIDALAERFRGVKLDALYSSDLRRAMLTADALRRFRPMELHTRFDLREINVGPWEARFFADIQHEQPRRSFSSTAPRTFSSRAPSATATCAAAPPPRWKRSPARTRARSSPSSATA